MLADQNGGITAQQHGKTSFLHIPAREEFNNTLVVCELIIRDPVRSTQFSDPAVLKVQGMCISSSRIVMLLCHDCAANTAFKFIKQVSQTMEYQNKAPETSSLFQEKYVHILGLLHLQKKSSSKVICLAKDILCFHNVLNDNLKHVHKDD